MKIVEGQSHYVLTPIAFAGNYVGVENTTILLGSEEAVKEYFEQHPTLYEYRLLKVVNQFVREE